MYAEDACHGHVKVRELHNFATPQILYLLPSRKILCIVAELPEVLRPKKRESSTFSVDGLPFGLVVFPGTCKWCRPSLNASIDPASGKEC